MIIRENVFECSNVVYDGGLINTVNVSHKKVVERLNSNNGPEFDIDGVTYYTKLMSIEYETHTTNILRAILVKESESGKNIDSYNLEINYNANTMILEEI